MGEIEEDPQSGERDPSEEADTGSESHDSRPLDWARATTRRFVDAVGRIRGDETEFFPHNPIDNLGYLDQLEVGNTVAAVVPDEASEPE